jgi:hypothetical protein
MQPKGRPVGSTRYASFLVRLWRAGDQGAALSTTTWQGEVEHIQTRDRAAFDSLDELLGWLHRQLEEADPAEHEA